MEGDREGSATETLIPCYIGRLTEQRFLPFRERLLDFESAWRSEINRRSLSLSSSFFRIRSSGETKFNKRVRREYEEFNILK